MSVDPLSLNLNMSPTKHGKRYFSELLTFCIDYIEKDVAFVPEHQKLWKIGRSFSWHNVKIIEYRYAQMCEEMDTIMARSKGKAKPESDFGKYEFVQCELNAEDKKTAKTWIEENTTELPAFMHDAVASDYKFSLSFSSEHDTFTACLTGKPDQAHNAYKILTSRHKDWISATLSCLYKHQVIFKSGVWESDAKGDDDGWA
jgi:hypothetical protein